MRDKPCQKYTVDALGRTRNRSLLTSVGESPLILIRRLAGTLGRASAPYSPGHLVPLIPRLRQREMGLGRRSTPAGSYVGPTRGGTLRAVRGERGARDRRAVLNRGLPGGLGLNAAQWPRARATQNVRPVQMRKPPRGAGASERLGFGRRPLLGQRRTGVKQPADCAAFAAQTRPCAHAQLGGTRSSPA